MLVRGTPTRIAGSTYELINMEEIIFFGTSTDRIRLDDAVN